MLEDDAGAQRELLHGAGLAGGDLDRETVRVHGVLVCRAGAGGEEAAEGAADADGADATAPRLPGREQAVDEEEPEVPRVELATGKPGAVLVELVDDALGSLVVAEVLR